MSERFSESVEHICDSVKRSLALYPLERIDDTLELVKEAQRIFVYGAGRSGLVGRMFAMRLMQIDLRAFFIGETVTPAINKEDCVIFISKTGETQTAIQAARIVKERVTGAKIIVLTASPKSRLASYGDVVMEIHTELTEKDSTLAPLGTIFENAALVFWDAFCSLLMEKLGETEDDMKTRHPILI